jgi:predicted nuclease of predicted toxin-antitoxin system
MRILVDENIPNITVHGLRTMGHDVLDIRGTEHQSMFDDELWPFAQSEQRLLTTTDKGFSEHRDARHHGILIVRLRQPNEQRIHARIMAAFRQFTEHDWPGLLVVMRDTVQSVQRGVMP